MWEQFSTHSSCPSNRRTQTYLMATVVLHGAVVNVAPTCRLWIQCLSKCMCVSVRYQHLLESHVCLPVQKDEDEKGNACSFFFYQCKVSQSCGLTSKYDYETAASQTATDTSGWVNSASPLQWISLSLSQCPLDLSEWGLLAVSVQQQLCCSPEPGI